MTPIVLAGPTASGKSALAVALAEALGGEVVCGDSRQVYQGMEIGTASPATEERARVPHAGYNVVPPEERYDAGRFVGDTDRYVDAAAETGRRAILVGGSGLYLRSWRYGLGDVPARDPAVRARLEDELARLGVVALHERLARADPEAARAIERTDPVRVVRALEILEVTGQRPSALATSFGRGPPRREARWILIGAPLDWLEPRLRWRARAMLEAGLVEEAVALRRRVGAGHRLLETMGYEEALALHDGALVEEHALAAMVKRQRQYARRQRTWFKKEPWWERVDARDPDLFARVLGLVRAR